MRSNYKKIGPYIRVVDQRNVEGKEENLLGVSVSKVFMKSIANTVGTDFTSYRVVKKNQFTYIPDTSRRGDKIGIALLDSLEEGLVSQAYTVFEVSDKNALLPEYLMMWFRRPEFDRYARFISHGSVREIFEWEDMCNVWLPIPHIDKQREIVKEYNTIVDCINLNNQLIQKLQETAQAIYKQWFVDFEFPDAEGKPYKSNGGEMEWNEKLEMEVPKGWIVWALKDFGNVITGKTPSSDTPEHFGNKMPFVTPGDFASYKKFALGAERNLSVLGANLLKSKILRKGTVIVTCIGSDMGKVAIATEDCITNQQMNSIAVFKQYYSDYLFYYLRSVSNELKSIAMGGSTMPMLSKTDFQILTALKPPDLMLEKFDYLLGPINEHMLIHSKNMNVLLRFKDLLLSKLATIEN